MATSWLLQFCSLYERIERFAFAFYSHATTSAFSSFFLFFFVVVFVSVDQNESKHKARPGSARPGRRSASSGEVFGHSICDAPKRPLLLQLLLLGVLSVLLSFFLFSALLFTPHTHTPITKETEIIYLKIQFLVTSFINFRFFLIFCLFISSRKLLLVSRSSSG